MLLLPPLINDATTSVAAAAVAADGPNGSGSGTASAERRWQGQRQAAGAMVIAERARWRKRRAGMVMKHAPVSRTQHFALSLSLRPLKSKDQLYEFGGSNKARCGLREMLLLRVVSQDGDPSHSGG